MSHQLSLDELARLRTDVRLLVEETSAHQHRVDDLVAVAERELRRAQMMAVGASAGVDAVRDLLRAYLQRCVDAALDAAQLQRSARSQHAGARRVLANMEGDERAQACWRNVVLVVDDYADVRALVASVLTGAGFIVRTASNGLEGLMVASEIRPGVILMDVAMPVLDGIEATRLIKASEATRDVRVIAHTGDSTLDRTLVPRLFATVLEKPASPDDVLATVQQLAGLATDGGL